MISSYSASPARHRARPRATLSLRPAGPGAVASYRIKRVSTSLRTTSTRACWSLDALAIARAPESGKDLPPLGKIPVPESRPGDERIAEPRTAAQHSVLVPEERPRSIPNREKPRSRDSRRRTTMSTARPRPSCARARRRRSCAAFSHSGSVEKALAGPPRIRLRLVKGDMLDGRVRGTRRDPRGAAGPLVPPGATPRPSSLQTSRPADSRPASTNARVVRIRHECAVDSEGRKLDKVCGLLVVVRPRIDCAERERTTGDSDLAARLDLGRPLSRRSRQTAKRQRLRHRLGVLQLMLNNHPYDETLRRATDRHRRATIQGAARARLRGPPLHTRVRLAVAGSAAVRARRVHARRSHRGRRTPTRLRSVRPTRRRSHNSSKWPM